MVAIRAEMDGAHAQPDKLLGAYLGVATLGMFLWDVLTNLSAEYHLLFKRKIGIPTLVYLWARANAVIGITLITLVFESLLLFFRLRAVYMDRKKVVYGFAVSLVIVTGCSCAIPFVAEAHPIGPTNAYCTATLNLRLAEAMLIVPLANHIAVFFAIAYQLIERSEITLETNRERTSSYASRLRKFFRGKRLRGISRTLVIDGQNYILYVSSSSSALHYADSRDPRRVFLLTTAAATAMMAIGHLPDTYRCVLVAFHAAVENSMNCYLFRSVRAKDTTVITDSTINFRQADSLSMVPQSSSAV
ncbi:hypothetical protein VNI00_003041 [Paramarasmius palmivorus]|uniref:Uncharacterized protein n=1 Tax=Paramarasmius palmivorus TaxID=297713 RepID=A0AAW0DZS4_9AGAR